LPPAPNAVENMHRYRWMMTGVMIFVFVATHVSYGEVTVLHHRRINWWGGQVSFMWGQRSGASGRLLSFDEMTINAPSFQRGTQLPSMTWSASGGRIGSPVWGFVLLGLLLIWVPVYHRRRMQESDACQSCGYLIVGITNTKCPECGASIDHDD